MLSSKSNFQLRLACAEHASDSSGSGAKLPPRVLVVEFQNDVFSKVESDLTQLGAQVGRATVGANAAISARRFSPDLVLISDSVPDESCYLIAAKLPFGGCTAPKWIYSTSKNTRYRGCLRQIGIERVIDCGDEPHPNLDRVARAVRQYFTVEFHVNVPNNKETISCCSKKTTAC